MLTIMIVLGVSAMGLDGLVSLSVISPTYTPFLQVRLHEFIRAAQ